tara:strand:- start:246 stop:734 length:489 start_codon:yes stop_codon:yes gene_type:complete
MNITNNHEPMRRNLIGKSVINSLNQTMLTKNIRKKHLAMALRTSSPTVGWWFSEERLPLNRILAIAEFLKDVGFVNVCIDDMERILSTSIQSYRKTRYKFELAELIKLKEKLEPKDQKVKIEQLEINEKIDDFSLIVNCVNNLSKALNIFQAKHIYRIGGSK